ncbi:unnamed protein product [Penicillium crustosum]
MAPALEEPTLVALLESVKDAGEMALELLATCIASSDLAVDDVGQVWQLLLDPTKEHLGGGVPVEDGIELAAEHSVCASGRDVALAELRASGRVFLSPLQAFNVVPHFVGELKATMHRHNDRGIPFSHIAHQPMTNGVGP